MAFSIATAVRVRQVSPLKSWWPGVSKRLKASPSCSKLITAEETEMPRRHSTPPSNPSAPAAARRAAATSPAGWTEQRQFLGQGGLAGVGCKMITKARRHKISSVGQGTHQWLQVVVRGNSGNSRQRFTAPAAE